MAHGRSFAGAVDGLAGVVPAVIVGIGYPTDQPFSAERHSDFTMLLSESELPVSAARHGPNREGRKRF